MTNKDLKDIQYHCRPRIPRELSTFRMRVYLLLNYFTMSKKVFKLIWNSIMPDASISELTYSLEYLIQMASIIEKSEYTQGNDGDLVEKLYVLRGVLEKSKYNNSGYYYMPTAFGELQFQGFCHLNTKLNYTLESYKVKHVISDLLIAKCNDIASRNGGRRYYYWARRFHKMRRLLYMDELIKDVILFLPES